MFALLVKPTVKQTRRGRRILANIHELGAIELTGANDSALRSELEELQRIHQDLIVVACGGDGTVNLAVNSLPDMNIPIAVVPLGTGNDFARFIGIKNPGEGIRILRSGVAAELDHGMISLPDGQTRNFVGVASCGFDAQVNERANRYRGPTGTLKYLVALLVELSKLSARELDIRISGEEIRKERMTLVAIGNTSSYGGGMKMCPTAVADDGLLEVTFVAEVSRRVLLRVLPKVFWGTHVLHPLVTQTSCAKIDISGEAFPVYADGERVGVGPVSVHVVAGGLRVWRAQPATTP
ncbi:MAG: diacylglycerol kinase family protein [Actinomycetes bacterium]